MEHDTTTVVVSSSSETMDVLAGVLRFGKSLRNRKGVLTTYLLVASLLGGSYFVFADRVYQSEGDLMVLPTGANVMDENNGKLHMSDGVMPNYERMVKGDPVIRATIKNIPPEHHCDLIGVPPNNWERAFRDRLSVSTAKNTNIMSVTFRSRRPETAYVVLSTLFTEYVRYLNGVYEEDIENRLEILRESQAELEQRIAEKEQHQLELLQDPTLLMNSHDDQTNIFVERVKGLNSLLSDAISRRLTAQVWLNSLEKAIANGEDLQHFYLGMTDAVGQKIFEAQMGLSSFDGQIYAKLQQDIIEDETALEDKLKNQGLLPNHPVVKELEASILKKRQALRELPATQREAVAAMMHADMAPQLRSMARQRLQNALDAEMAVQAQYDEVSAEAARLNNRLISFNLVKSELQTMRANLAELQSAMNKILLDQKHGLVTQITRDPQIDPSPVAPRLPLVAVISLFLGFTAASATVYVMDLLDDRFHTPDDLRRQIGAPILAMVRRLTPLAEHGIESLQTYSRPNSPESEAFRTLRAALEFTNGGARRITISSTEPSDGKTTIISNLAVAFAQSGKRTLLIDGDMRRPGLTRLFERGGHAGLSSILRDTRPIVESVQNIIVPTELDRLHVLPAGPRPGNPVELLTSERLSDLIAWAESNYDQLLIDAPPSLAVTDAAIIGRLLDGAILTVRPDKNRRKLVLRAAEALTSLGCELQGVVINSVQPRTDLEYGYGYGYGHSEYGHNDVDTDEDAPQSSTEAADSQPDAASTIGIKRDRSTRPSRLRRAA